MDQRVYYVSERMMKIATNFGREHLLSIGTCVGRFTKVAIFCHFSPFSRSTCLSTENGFPVTIGLTINP